MNKTVMWPHREQKRREATQLNGAGGWGRGQLIGLLAASCAVVMALVVGLIFGMANLVHRPSGAGATSSEIPPALQRTQPSPVAQGLQSDDENRTQARDLIAGKLMVRVPAEAMLEPDDLSTQTPLADSADVDPEAIEVPAGTDPGPASVLTGYPHTSEGAVGQLAQIETTVLQAMSLEQTHEVYRSWALPGGSGAEAWTLTRNVESFLTSAGMGGSKDPSSVITVEPVGGLVKGVDGDDWNVVCVLVKITAVYRQTDQAAYGHCERMQWQAGRWMIGPGSPPAPAPSTWPGTSWATAAGWRAWVTGAGVGTDL